MKKPGVINSILIQKYLDDQFHFYTKSNILKKTVIEKTKNHTNLFIRSRLSLKMIIYLSLHLIKY